MTKIFILIDAHSLIYRSHFAFIKNPLKNSKGMITSGIFGFLNTLQKIKEQFTTEHIVLAFDAPGKTFRDEVYEAYKATRPPTPPELPYQVQKIKEICRLLGLTIFELEGYEADDILATCANKLQHQGKVYIVTSDKDLMQLVNKQTFIYDVYNNIIYDRARVIKKFGVPPEGIGDFLALTGDASDNIPGVPGIGPKRALGLLKKYASFNEIIKNEKKVIAHQEQALLSRQLVKLEYNVPLNIELAELKNRKPETDKLMPLLLDLELHSFIKTLTINKNLQEEYAIIEQTPTIKKGQPIAIYQEDEKKVLLCVESGKVCKLSTAQAKNILLNPEYLKIGYDLKTMVREKKIQPPLFDIMIVDWLIDPGRKNYRLEEIILKHLNEYLTMTPANIAGALFKLYSLLKQRLEELEELTLYEQIEAPLIPVLAKMEERGINIDLEYFRSLSKEFNNEIKNIKRKIYDLAGREFNINSPKQLATILFEEMKLKPSRRGKTHYSTRVDVLQQLARFHPLPEEILKYREYTKIESTYIKPLVASAHAGRISTTFNQTGTATGRLSSSNPNIQNIPIRTALGRRIRKGFISSSGFLLVSADYSQIELRILAHIADDKTLITAFNEGKDIHTHTASLVFGIKENEIDQKKRRMAKVVNYGLIYGMSDYGLAQGLDISQEQALQFIQSYYNLYPGVATWREQAIKLAREKGYTETLFHRKRPLPLFNSNNHNLQEFAKRTAINTPIQGTAADIIKLAMIWVEKELTKAGFKRGLLLSIHDELVFEIEAKRIQEARALIKQCMESIISLKVPLVVNIGEGNNLNEIH